jgi:protein-S-isoprenylcysteine O-methyltransferase Ste14
MIASPPLWILTALWVGWLLPFVVRRRGGGQKPAVTVRRARWGMLLQGLAFGIGAFRPPSQPSPSAVRIAIATALGLVAITIGISATSVLGKQWRLDAALNPDHRLIQSGPYAIVRHPIYASMLLMLAATAFIVSNWIAFCVALVFYFIGTEIRIRIEENLLIAHFGNRYENYRQRVFAYLPGLR